MSAHTPGPWHWSDAYPMLSTGDKTWSLIGSDGYGILSCDGVENSPQGLNDHANVHLIAAAPDLLAALDALVTACEVPGENCEIEQALPEAIAAIAKATGEMP